MVREVVTIQVGQCGNQIGSRFWKQVLREHAHHSPHRKFDEPLSTFFRNVDSRFDDPLEIPVGDGTGEIRSLKARAVLVDMEEGVVNEMMRSDLGDLFDTRQFLTDVSGSGNNWAHGHEVYGPQYAESILEKIRRAAEFCDSLQSFFLLHSLGGGTGSGVGSYILEMLADNYPDKFRFTTSVFPSQDDDVITSPYNSILSLAELRAHADCVLPVENQALLEMCERVDSTTAKKSTASTITAVVGSKAKAFDHMNNIVAQLLINLTSSMRFEGSLNVDLNEITMNLVPYPRMHFLLSSLSPLYTPSDIKLQPRRLDQVFTDVFSRTHQLLKVDPRQSMYLACGLLVRGDAQISDINRNINRIRPELRIIHWNQEGFKVGLCSVPPVGQPYSLLCLSNNTCFRHTCSALHDRFLKLYKRKAHLHHYTQYMDVDRFEMASSSIQDLVKEYCTLEQATPPSHLERMIPIL